MYPINELTCIYTITNKPIIIVKIKVKNLRLGHTLIYARSGIRIPVTTNFFSFSISFAIKRRTNHTNSVFNGKLPQWHIISKWLPQCYIIHGSGFSAITAGHCKIDFQSEPSNHKSMVKIPYSVELRVVFTAGNPGPSYTSCLCNSSIFCSNDDNKATFRTGASKEGYPRVETMMKWLQPTQMSEGSKSV